MKQFLEVNSLWYTEQGRDGLRVDLEVQIKKKKKKSSTGCIKKRIWDSRPGLATFSYKIPI